MKILFVVPYVPALHSNGGSWRMFAMMKELAARGHQISVIGFANTESELPDAKPLEKFCKEVKILVRKQVYSFQNFLSRGFLDNDFFMPSFAQELDKMLAKTDYDIVQYEYYQMAMYIRQKGKAIVFSDYESPFLIAERAVKRLPALLNFFKQSALLARTDWVLKHVDAFISLTDVDAQSLQKYFPDAKPQVINTGVDLEYFAHAISKTTTQNLIFVGYFLHTPNVEAMTFFAKKVLPLVWKKDPNVKLFIVGKSPSPEILDLANAKITVTGFVEDTREFMKQSGIYVVPILSGAGMRGKVLEAWAAQLPVVSTSLGAEGIKITDGEDILLANTAAEFANCIHQLLHDQKLRNKIAKNGRAAVEKLYGWKAKIDELENLYQVVLSKSKK